MPSTAFNFEKFAAIIREIVPRNDVSFAADHPVVGGVIVFGALAGLFGGVAVTPSTGSSTFLAINVCIGTALGLAGSYGAVVLISRHFKVDVVQPLGFGMLGLAASLGIAELVASLFRRAIASEWIYLAFALAGAFGGGYFGLLKSRRRSTAHRPDDEWSIENPE